jgi:hypothetical protein
MDDLFYLAIGLATFAALMGLVAKLPDFEPEASISRPAPSRPEES